MTDLDQSPTETPRKGWLRRNIDLYGWRIYAIPVLAVVTLLVLADTLWGSTDEKKNAPPPPEPEVPTNAVPFGQGGRPALAYGQFTTGAGPAGIGFGDGTFGNRYGWYVDSITRRISQNWLQSLVDQRVHAAPRVYLSFDIDRSGKISNITLMQPSGIPTLDRSAQRAILASNPLPPLPPDYRGSSVNVSFYFEYAR